MTGMSIDVHEDERNSDGIRSDASSRSHLMLSKQYDSEPKTPRIRLKSDILKAQKPFSLEASTLKPPLRDLAQTQVATTITRNDYNCSEVDHVAVEWQHV